MCINETTVSSACCFAITIEEFFVPFLFTITINNIYLNITLYYNISMVASIVSYFILAPQLEQQPRVAPQFID